MVRIADLAELEAALRSERALIYKHSTACGLSSRARSEVRQFAEDFPDAPVYVVDVLANRTISNEVATRFGIRHESPQVILVEEGEPVRDASHHDVRADLLQRWWTR